MQKTIDKNKLAVKAKLRQMMAKDLQYEVVSDKKIILTAERAFAFLEMPTFEGERQVSQRHVQYLADQFSTGRFMWEQAVIGTCWLGEQQYRINGQHTCWLRVNITEKIEPQVKELIYRVKDMANLRGLYCTWDRNKSRSNSHSFKAMAVGSQMADGLWTSTLGKLAAGLIFWKFGDTREARQMTPEDIAALAMEQYPDLYKSVGMLFQELLDTFKPIGRAAVLAAVFATMESKPDKNRDFWGPVCTGLGLNEKTDPRYALRNFLQTHGRGTRGSDLMSTSSEDMYKVCINAWNKWRKNKPVQVLKTTEEREKAV